MKFRARVMDWLNSWALERRTIETHDAIGNLQRLFEIADEHNRRAFVGMSPQGIDDVGARAGVDALKRFVEQQQPRAFDMPAREDDFLLIAAG